MRFELACFDLDGTLVDSMADIRAALACALAAVGPPDPIRDGVALSSVGLGLPLEEFFALARPSGNASERLHFIDAYRGHYHANLLATTRPYEGVEETLDKLSVLRKRGLRTAVCTTKKTDTARRVINGLHLERHFDVVLGTDGIPHKPAPDLLYLAARTVERSPALGIMIGDTERDVRAGRAAGMKSCGVSWGVLGRPGLEAEAADFIIDQFSQLLQIFEI